MPSNHPRLKTLPGDFFAGLCSFRELEERIAALTESGLQRGDALEIFVEAHLQTSQLFQVEELWLVNQIPLSVRRQLKLPSDSKGIDGVYRKRDGSLASYQVKFRQGRPQVGVGDTSSFFMLTENAEQRVLISNCDRYAKEIRNRDNLLIVGGTYFDELTGEDFARIEKWLKNKRVMPIRERPMRTHQAKAVEAIVKQLQAEARTTAVMPCGTGKTLVGLRAVEALNPKNVVVFVPSLALLAQLLEDWAKDTIWGERFRYLCVCSQPSVSAEVDRWELSPTDVHFPVTTDPVVVRRFLKHDSDKDITRVIFSTYQSAKKVAEGLPRGFRFDVGLFDEAHKTTEGGFTLALHDENLPIDRRLFLTATPRHIDIKRRDKQGDFKVVSMDNPEVYGQPAFSQSFPEAVEEGIICDYRVVVATVDRSEVSEHAERYGITLVQGDENATRWVASQIAVTRAIEETGASKLITFHSRVQQAKDFASDTSRGIGQFLPAFRIGHVNGTQPVTDRKDVLSGFRGNEKMLVTNARCLTEGVDLPAVDAVVFNNPRRSKVDIVQAVGRAMRKPLHSKKELGYVVIPILLEHKQTDDLEESCRGTEWEDLVAVLAALRDHDSRLDDIIREAKEAVGRGEVFDPRPFGEKIKIFGRPQIPLSIIQRHVGAVILERLGQTWDYRYGQLKRYKETHGNCCVPKTHSLQLAEWVIMQRQLRKRGILSTSRIGHLDALGFVWDAIEAVWEANFAKLKQFRITHGHCDVSVTEDRKLATWVANQRAKAKRGELRDEHRRRLNEISFTWDTRDALWGKRCKQLEAYYKKHGNCRLPWNYRDKALYAWVSNQRSARKEGKLSDEQIARLTRMGFDWDPFGVSFEEFCLQLEQYKEKHGDCDVPSRSNSYPWLGQKLAQLRNLFRTKQLSQERINRLLAIGVVFYPLTEKFEQKFAKLAHFHQQHGHCNVATEDSGSKELLTWVTNLRAKRRKSKWGGRQLTAKQISRLNQLSFIWNPKEAAQALWNQRVSELRAFIKTHGHSNVPLTHPANQSFANWWRNTRSARNVGKLNKRKEVELEQLGVSWFLDNSKWDSMFEQLKVYWKQFGNCKVPYNYAENPKLGRWVGTQIYERRKKITRRNTAERVQKLASIGFWDDWAC